MDLMYFVVHTYVLHPIKLPYKIWNRHIKTTPVTYLQIHPSSRQKPNQLQCTARFTAIPQQKLQENKR